MDIEQFHIEKQDNFVLFISELRAEYSLGANCIGPDLDYESFQGYKILLRAAIAGGTMDSYVKQFLLEDRIDFKLLPAERLNKLKRYLEMFSEL